MYEKLDGLNKEKSFILDEKAKTIAKTKELNLSDEQEKELADEIARLNKLQEENQASIAKLQELIGKKEKETAEEAEKAEEEKTKSLKTGGKMMNYLDTKQSVADFAKTLSSSLEAGDFENNWKTFLAQKGITEPESYLPTPVVNEIKNVYTESSSFYSSLRHTGLPMYGLRVDLNNEPQAYGHKMGNDKVEQEVETIKLDIRPAFVYKYLTVPRELLVGTDGALINFVLDELPKNLIAALERAVVIGDGLDETDEKHVYSFEPICDSKLAQIEKVEGTTELIDAIQANNQTLSNPQNAIAILDVEVMKEIKKAKNANGDYIYGLGASIEQILNVKSFYAPGWMTGTGKIVIFDPSQYFVVGKSEFDSFENFKLKRNEQEFLIEAYAGGALTSLRSAIVIELVTP